ncbi:52 kDa repressor of the inhibitor of the protein kinase-like [Bacillus rossius redtenbacheri]|uniref:52 kDa repressor of the inhibitor of the protein kinase-like n=1 Tax=Bacillus rossius redtenbacheri TaxID=93214 RepID=UPI002FDDA54B
MAKVPKRPKLGSLGFTKNIESYFSRASSSTSQQPQELSTQAAANSGSEQRDAMDAQEQQGAIARFNGSSVDCAEAVDCNVGASESGSVNYNSVNHPSHQNDVGLHIGVGTLISDYTKCQLLENHWTPPCDYSFPFSVKKEKCREYKRYLSKKHIDMFHWVVFSHAKKGLFCVYCSLFSAHAAGHNNGMKLGKLVTEPLTKFSKLTGKDGDLEVHDKTEYHNQNVIAGKRFLQSYHNPEFEVINLINSQRLQQVNENRARLRPIIETIIFCGRQNIPLRGHRDDGVLLDDCTPANNEGNFRELLRFKVASGDKELENHLSCASSRATYIGKNTQNELIECCGDEIQSIILGRIKKAGFYAIIFDETTDVAHIEQLSLSVRYFYEMTIIEDFIMFIGAYKAIDGNCQHIGENKEIGSDCESEVILEPRLTGKSIGKLVVQMLSDSDLDPLLCVGISTDSCSVMVSESSGAVTEIMGVTKNATRCSCQNHCLNNSISQSSKVSSIRNTVSIIKTCISFFNQSAKRHKVLRKFSSSNIASLCETRWVERHTSLLQFREHLPSIVKALSAITSWQDSKSASKALTLLNSLLTSEFILAMLSLLDVLKITLPLSTLLQAESLDMHEASNAVRDTLSVLKTRRENSDNTFHVVFSEAKTLASKLDVEIRKPRTTAKQIHRENYDTDDAECYYRAIYNSMLDFILIDMKSRFSEDCLKSFDIRLLVPHILLNRSKDVDFRERLKAIASRFSFIQDNQESVLFAKLEGEVCVWEAKWFRELKASDEVEVPKTAMEAILKCEEEMFPTIFKLLKILVTLPISVATAERSFSTLRRSKTWLRSRILEERLNGLCLLHIHRDISINIDNIIERFAKKGKRRLDFVV